MLISTTHKYTTIQRWLHAASKQRFDVLHSLYTRNYNTSVCFLSSCMKKMLLSNSLIPVVEGHLPTKKIELAAGNIIFNFRSFLFDIFVDTENKNMVSIVLKNVHVHGQIN